MIHLLDHNLGKTRNYSLTLITILVLFPKLFFAQQILFTSPLKKLHITSYYGMRNHPIQGVRKFHYGVDFSARTDTIRSVLTGTIKQVGYNKDLGNFVCSTHGNIELTYGHLSLVNVNRFEQVSAGQIIGITGTSGKTTGEHLHFSVKVNGKHVDPLKFLDLLHNPKNIN